MAFQSTQDDYNNDIKLDPSVQLQDSVSNICWMNPTSYNNCPTMFATTCWDKTIRIFELTQNYGGNSIVQKAITNLTSPGICCTWSPDNTSLYVGCGDGAIKQLNLNTMGFTDVGKHNAGISGIHFSANMNILISTAYENSINFWQGGPNPIFQLDIQNKVFTSDFSNNTLVGGTAN